MSLPAWAPAPEGMCPRGPMGCARPAPARFATLPVSARDSNLPLAVAPVEAIELHCRFIAQDSGGFPHGVASAGPDSQLAGRSADVARVCGVASVHPSAYPGS